jgi:hypothetical protein
VAVDLIRYACIRNLIYRGAGRKPGVPNKFTAELKEALLLPYDRCNSDGRGSLNHLKAVSLASSFGAGFVGGAAVVVVPPNLRQTTAPQR